MMGELEVAEQVEVRVDAEDPAALYSPRQQQLARLAGEQEHDRITRLRAGIEIVLEVPVVVGVLPIGIAERVGEIPHMIEDRGGRERLDEIVGDEHSARRLADGEL